MRTASPVDTRPAFRRIHSHLIERIARGEWRPGEMMPGENDLAGEYGVSVGTMRKALDVLQAENVVERRRGRGTTVRRSTLEHTLFSYFRFRNTSTGALEPPADHLLSHGRFPANAAERAALRLQPGALVIRLRRLRHLGGQPFLTDVMSFGDSLFPDFTWPSGAPSASVYQYIEREFGAMVTYVQERLRTVPLGISQSRLLGVAVATPALEVLRTAFDLSGAAVEYRRSVALTDRCFYLSELRQSR